MAITLRNTKGIALTHNELDGNFIDLNDRTTCLESCASNSITSTQIDNWDCAYGWGDHSQAGYCTTETSHADVVVDGDFTSAGLMTTDGNGVYNITTNNSSNWDTAYGWGDHACAGYLTSETDGQTLCLVGTDLSISNGNTVDLCGIGGTSYTDSDVDTHLNTSTASPNEVLSWTGTVYDWVAPSGGGSADLTWTITKNSDSSSFEFSGPGIETGNTFNPELQLIRGYTYKFSDTDNPTTLEIRTSENGSAYTPGVTTSVNLTTFTVPYDAPDTLYYETTASSLIHGVIKIVNANNGLQSRTTVSGGAFIPPGPSHIVDITGYKGYNLYKITTSVAARVIVYTSPAARTADSGRAEGTDPTPNSGVIAEVITTGAETVTFSPGVIGYNDENPVTNKIPIRLQNKTASTATTTATLTVVQTEV